MNSDDADDGKAATGLMTREHAAEWWEEAGEKVSLEMAATFVDPLQATL